MPVRHRPPSCSRADGLIGLGDGVGAPVYGHSGNTSSYTQFVAATADGSESVTVSINAQITLKTNAVAFGHAAGGRLAGVCAALGHRPPAG